MNDNLLYMTKPQLAELWKTNSEKVKSLRSQLQEAEHLQESSEFLLGISLREEEAKEQFVNKLLQG